MSTVRVRESCVVTPSGGTPIALRVHDAYDDDDPIVREFPAAFVSDVEQATAAPGEKRNARRTSD